MFTVVLEKNTKESITSASFLNLLLSIRKNGQLPSSIYKKTIIWREKGKDLT